MLRISLRERRSNSSRGRGESCRGRKSRPVSRCEMSRCTRRRVKHAKPIIQYMTILLMSPAAICVITSVRNYAEGISSVRVLISPLVTAGGKVN